MFAHGTVHLGGRSPVAGKVIFCPCRAISMVTLVATALSVATVVTARLSVTLPAPKIYSPLASPSFSPYSFSFHPQKNPFRRQQPFFVGPVATTVLVASFGQFYTRHYCPATPPSMAVLPVPRIGMIFANKNVYDLFL